ncbi:Pyrroline-5-carboxylate reductase [Porphyridium purpureum]|uniref:Pyrroline-5-carboxylate reductase n=1 Tax=Porphyridium purpureum TaxID=35688 RepID=A0A5J4YKL1_PORPP|nr:Pyrroline-5-carboxylate reductase [Porphyridium purpureum]|eukprot:POR6963..scf244_11
MGDKSDGLRMGFLGGGMMAEALVRGLLNKDMIDPAQCWVSDVSQPRLDVMGALGLNATFDGEEVLRHTDIVVLAVKPDTAATALEPTRSTDKAHLIISICAGVTLSSLESFVGPKTRVVRVMPNTPCLVGATAAGYALGAKASQQDSQTVDRIFASVGLARAVPEKLLDAVTGVSGSGPAYVYMFIEALADGGVLNGLPRDTARALAAQVVYGTAKMVLENPDTHVGELRNRVESPGGTTIAGTNALEQGQFRGTVMNAVSAATTRAKEMGGN